MTAQRGTIFVVTDDIKPQFDVVFRQHCDFVYTLARALLNNEQDAEDAVQEVFIRVYRYLGSYDEMQGSMEQWLHTILLNYCRDRWRKRNLLSIPFSLLARNYNGGDKDGDWESALARATHNPGQDSGLDSTLLRGETRSEIWAAVNSLNEKLRRVVVLRYYMELSGSEVADILGLPEGTVYSRLHHARTILQKSLTHTR